MKFIQILFSVSLFITLFSCQKVINVNLNDAKPQYVIEASMYEGTQDFKVRITQTTSYFEPQSVPLVNDAVVTLYDGNQNALPLNATGNGWYELPNFTALNFNTYQLQVAVGGKVFKAQATMPAHTNIDSLSYQPFGGFGPPGSQDGDQLVKVHFVDSGGVKNYYRVLITRNDTLQAKPGNYYLFDDQLRDGLQIDAPLFTTLFNKNDKADIQLLGMDESVYDYFNTLSEVITGDANTGAAPANPNSNFSGGALGYFAVYSSSSMSIVIQ